MAQSYQSDEEEEEEEYYDESLQLVELVPRNKQPKDYLNNSDCTDSCTENEKDEEALQNKDDDKARDTKMPEAIEEEDDEDYEPSEEESGSDFDRDE